MKTHLQADVSLSAGRPAQAGGRMPALPEKRFHPFGRGLRTLYILILLANWNGIGAANPPSATFDRARMPLKVARGGGQKDSFLHYYTDLTRRCGIVEVPASDYAVLDALVDDAHRFVPNPPATTETRKTAILRIRNLVENNYRERIKALAYTKAIMPENYSNDCVHRGLLYHALGCAIGLPVYLVALPKCKTAETAHVALRVDPDGKHHWEEASHPENAGDFYWEATSGHEEPLKYYLDHFSFTPELRKREVYLVNLDAAEGLAYFGSALLMRAKDWRKVTADNAPVFIELARAMASVSRVPGNLRNAASGISMSAAAVIKGANKTGWESIRVTNENLHYYRESLAILDRALELDETYWMWRQDQAEWRHYIREAEKAADQARKAGKL